MDDARLQEQTDEFVSYYDAGSGVYLTWSPSHPGISILSQDKARQLGWVPSSSGNPVAADQEIRDLINDPEKRYGRVAGLWD